MQGVQVAKHAASVPGCVPCLGSSLLSAATSYGSVPGSADVWRHLSRGGAGIIGAVIDVVASDVFDDSSMDLGPKSDADVAGVPGLIHMRTKDPKVSNQRYGGEQAGSGDCLQGMPEREAGDTDEVHNKESMDQGSGRRTRTSGTIF